MLAACLHHVGSARVRALWRASSGVASVVGLTAVPWPLPCVAVRPRQVVVWDFGRGRETVMFVDASVTPYRIINCSRRQTYGNETPAEFAISVLTGHYAYVLPCALD